MYQSASRESLRARSDTPQTKQVCTMLVMMYELPFESRVYLKHRRYLRVVEHEARARVDGRRSCVGGRVNFLTSMKLESFELGFSEIRW